MNQQELFQQAQMLEQELQRVEQHRKAIEEELMQISQFNTQLRSIPQAKDMKLLAPLGRGVYARTKVESSTLLVQVGAGVVVERKIDEVQSLLEKNVSQLQQAFNQLQMQEQFYIQQLQALLQQAESFK
jgi:prefoldin alpha subunit